MAESEGGNLREQLEGALEESKAKDQRIADLTAKDVLSSGDYPLLSADDFKGLSADEIESKAPELQTQREALQEASIRKALEAKGLEGDDLDREVKAMLDPTVAATNVDAVTRVRDLGHGGAPPPGVDLSSLTSQEKIAHGLEKRQK